MVWPTGLNTLPDVGSRHTLQLKHPFVATDQEPFWMLFEPVLSRVNGWDEHPEEIARSGLVQCRLVELVSADDYRPVVVVAVVQTVVMTGLRDHFPQTDHGALTVEPERVVMEVVVRGGLVWRSWSMQSDVGGWGVYLPGDDDWALVLSCQWGFHESHVFAGHRRLTDDEAGERGLP